MSNQALRDIGAFGDGAHGGTPHPVFGNQRKRGLDQRVLALFGRFAPEFARGLCHRISRQSNYTLA
ncbi:hypothetical protein GCM10016455_13100 [Aliiroseovarius zhejiangensis]|uniref:Uncharacterized protein n=1 Tax=Aliiroseovarius zhejiangensis TaxID=1632025 RepID=A0ABQ3IWY3_9RHOB|nr:hypothetical protein GCM10016455_13100 [Aliiroseovarius zhejiangensis]